MPCGFYCLQSGMTAVGSSGLVCVTDHTRHCRESRNALFFHPLRGRQGAQLRALRARVALPRAHLNGLLQTTEDFGGTVMPICYA